MSNNNIKSNLSNLNVFKDYHIKTNSMFGKIEDYLNDNIKSKSENIIKNEKINDKDNVDPKLNNRPKCDDKDYSKTSIKTIINYILNDEEYQQNLNDHLGTIYKYSTFIEKIIGKLSLEEGVRLVTKLTIGGYNELLTMEAELNSCCDGYDYLKKYLKV